MDTLRTAAGQIDARRLDRTGQCADEPAVNVGGLMARAAVPVRN
jgi:hypothetical protein